MRAPWAWGATPEEHRRRYPAEDQLESTVEGRDVRLTRAVSVQAPAPLVYRWVCQLSQAPYSYDLLDNLGHRSPRELTPGAEELRVGDRVMIFTLTDVRPGHQLTMHTTPAASRLFGPLAVTYAVESVDDGGCRLVCRIAGRTSGGLGRLRGLVLAWGDLAMMRKQLLTLRDLAERDALVTSHEGAAEAAGARTRRPPGLRTAGRGRRTPPG